MSKLMQAGVAGALLLAAACSSGVDVEDIPLGAAVQVTRDDGALVEGKLAERSPEDVTIDKGATKKVVPVDEIADVRVVPPDQPEPEPPPMAKFREFTVPADTSLAIEMKSAVNTGTAGTGDAIRAVLAEPVMVEGTEVLPAGSELVGHVTEVEPAGKVKGWAHVVLEFDRLTARDELYPVVTRFEASAPSTKKDDAKKIGIGAVGGAVLGAVIGGKKGAAIGATIGGGAGTAAVLMTDGGEIAIADGAKLSVTLRQPVDVKVPIAEAR